MVEFHALEDTASAIPRTIRWIQRQMGPAGATRPMWAGDATSAPEVGPAIGVGAREGEALRRLYSSLEGSTSARRLDLGRDGVWAFRFEKGATDAVVLWADDGRLIYCFRDSSRHATIRRQ